MKYYTLLLVLIFTSSCKSTSPKPETVVSLPYEIKKPVNLTNNSPLLILLHGYGSNKKDLFSFAQRLDPKLVVVCPQAPIALQKNRFAWYNLNLNSNSEKYQYTDVQKAKSEIQQFISQIQTKYGLQESKVIVGGFSQGAIMSLYMGLTEPEFIDGVIALSGQLYPEVRNEIKFNPQLNKLKIFMSHGKQDNVLSFKEAEEGYHYLHNRGLKVANFWYDSKHQITPENFRDMQSWIAKQL